MEQFRDFGDFKGFVIDSEPINGEYRVAKTNGEILYVKEKLYNKSKEVAVNELDKIKLEGMAELYYDWTCEKPEVQVAFARELCEDWKRLSIEDELVEEEEFGLIFRKELYYRTYEEIGRMGYQFAKETDEEDEEEVSRIVYKEFPMNQALTRCEAKLRLIGLDSNSIEKEPEYIRLLEEYVSGISKKELYPFKVQTREWGIEVYEVFEPHFDTKTISHTCGFSTAGLPLTRELAIEAAERMLGKRR